MMVGNIINVCHIACHILYGRVLSSARPFLRVTFRVLAKLSYPVYRPLYVELCMSCYVYHVPYMSYSARNFCVLFLACHFLYIYACFNFLQATCKVRTEVLVSFRDG